MCDPNVVDVTVLDQEMYSEAEAARLLRVPPSTLNYWLEGGVRRGKRYEPIIREVAKGGHPPVTWAEFVECGWLRQFRRVNRVPMAELRAFITRLREDYGVPYPLAHAKPFANEGQLVRMQRIQFDVGLAPEWCAVAEVSGQLVLTAPLENYVARVDWDDPTDGIVTAWRPHDVSGSPVRCRPDVRFGRPEVAGISTDVLWEQVDDGATLTEVAADFGVRVKDVRWAVSYETAPQAA